MGSPLGRDTLRETLAALGELAAGQVTQEAEAVRRILAAMLRVQAELEVEGQALDTLTPETILRLDAVLDALLEGGITENELRVVLRHWLIRTVH
jgi:hypothetical protein